MLCYSDILREQLLNLLARISLHLENNWNQTLKGCWGGGVKKIKKHLLTKKRITNLENA